MRKQISNFSIDIATIPKPKEELRYLLTKVNTNFKPFAM